MIWPTRSTAASASPSCIATNPTRRSRDYCAGQLDRAAKLAAQLQSKIKQTLQGGSFVFRGQATAVSASNADLLEAAKKLLADVADAGVRPLCRGAGARGHRYC